MASIDALVEALKQFEGTLIFISHDVYFIRALANKVVHVNAGKLTHYAGDYQYYLDKSAATSARAGLTAGQRPEAAKVNLKDRQSAKDKDQKRQEAEVRQAKSRAKKEQQEIVFRLEKTINDLEKRQVELTAQLEKPETYEKPGWALQVNRELSAVTEDLEKVTADWESAATKLAGIEAGA
jgi:ATP-binding cassette subfamily F protein 3